MPTRAWIDWNQPLIPAVTERLLRSVTEGTLIDLSQTMVIVPTVQSGRRLQEALAVKVSSKNTGLFPPRILTADQLLAQSMPKEGLANPSQQLAAWALTLKQIDPERFTALFPKLPTRSTGWLLGMAERLRQLRAELGETGLDFETAAQAAVNTPYEPLRWHQLAQLEAIYFSLLASQSLQDPQRVRRDIAQHCSLPDDITEIILIANPDPQPLPIIALEQLEQRTPISVWIYGPESEDALFDAWGRPDTEAWANRALDLEGWQCHLKTTKDADSAAQAIAQHAKGARPESLAIGLADPNLNTRVSQVLTRHQIPHFDPGGKPITQCDLGRLTELLAELSLQSDTNHVRSCLQHPDLWRWISHEIESTANQSQALRQLDQVVEQHLAADLNSLLAFSAQATHFATIDQALKALRSLVHELTQNDQPALALTHVLQKMYADKTIGTQDSEWKECAGAIRECVDEMISSETLHNRLGLPFSKQSFSRMLRNARTYPDRPHEAHDLLGWLELLWCDAPHLVLAGLNEGIVPESVGSDAFLPEPLREHLGLRTNAQRFARDSYLLEALCRRRANQQGRIDILVPQSANDQTPLKPSRLLFLGSPETLLPRTRQLFAETSHEVTHNQHAPAWRLSPPTNLPLPRNLSVSALKSYLECPFRFFLRHILKMRPLEIDSRELTPAKFGTLIHDSLSHLKGETLDQTFDVNALSKDIERRIENQLHEQYGTQLSFALRLQKEALISRGLSFAQIQIEDIQQRGSRFIHDTEASFEMKINDCVIRGQIDRIDHRGDQVELIDYKTADSPKSPEKAHLAVVAQKDPPVHLPEAALFEHEGKTYRWIDLQLPLYLLSQKDESKTRPSVAYFNLAKTQDKSAIERWEGFTQSHLDSALACAEAIIAQIQDGIFWPPNMELREEYDDFAAYFPDGIEKSVIPEAFQRYVFDRSTPIPTQPNLL